MSPRKADPQVRTSLLEKAAGLVAEGGSEALTLRSLAERAGTSTMALYTHFGSMGALRAELSEEAFSRLRGHLASVPLSGDPVYDLAVLGAAYYRNAMDSPDLYQVMFQHHRMSGSGNDVGYDTFETLVSFVERMLRSDGVGCREDPSRIALQIWGLLHGLVELRLSGLLTDQEVISAAAGGVGDMLVGLGAQRPRTEHSLLASAPFWDLQK